MRLHVADARFARGARILFDRLTFTLDPGQVMCVLGPNGVGKTTLLRCLAGLERLASGRIRFGGHDLQSIPRRRVGQLVGMVPQGDAPAFSFTVRQMVEMGRAPHLGWLAAPGAADRAVGSAALDRLGVAHLAHRAYPELSGGERQLVLIARSLAQQPRLLILDEPTAHLDFANQAHVLDLVQGLARQGLAVLLTTHDPGHAFRVGVTALLMSHTGPPQFGPTAEVLTEPGLAHAYGRPVTLRRVAGRTICVT